MTGIEPIIYFISAVSAEAVKDVSKHIGKKAKEFYDNLHEDIIKLEIDKADNNEVIQQKLEAKPEIKANIEQKVLENQDFFDEILKVFREKSTQNTSNIDIRDIEHSPINITLGQNGNMPDNPQKPDALKYITALFGLLAFFGLLTFGIIFATTRLTETTIINSTANSITNGAVNLQPTVTPTNINANRSIADTNVKKPIISNTKPTVEVVKREEIKKKPIDKNKVPKVTSMTANKVPSKSIDASNNNKRINKTCYGLETTDPTDDICQ
jgi:hypothetical protein